MTLAPRMQTSTPSSKDWRGSLPPRAKSRSRVDRICGGKEAQTGEASRRNGEPYYQEYVATAVKVKGESCRPKGNDHKPGGPSFCRKGKEVETVEVSLDVVISGYWNHPRRYHRLIEAWVLTGLKTFPFASFSTLFSGNKAQRNFRKIFLASWRNCRSTAQSLHVAALDWPE